MVRGANGGKSAGARSMDQGLSEDKEQLGCQIGVVLGAVKARGAGRVGWQGVLEMDSGHT